LLTRHPAAVRKLTPHVPPAVTLLPDGQKWLDRFVALYDLYCTSGIYAAQAHFRAELFPPSDQQATAHAPETPATVAGSA
jgi:hypothetical protein